jgi:hypothetical protein
LVFECGAAIQRGLEFITIGARRGSISVRDRSPLSAKNGNLAGRGKGSLSRSIRRGVFRIAKRVVIGME